MPGIHISMAPTDDRPERKWKIRKHGEEAAFHCDWPTFGPRHRIVGDSAVGSDNERRNGRVSDIAIESSKLHASNPTARFITAFLLLTFPTDRIAFIDGPKLSFHCRRLE